MNNGYNNMELAASRRRIAQAVCCYHLHTYSTRQNSKAHHPHRINMTQQSMPPAKLLNTCTIKKLVFTTCKCLRPPSPTQLELISPLKVLPCRRSHALHYLFLAVLQHVLELGELLVLIRFDAFGFVSETAGVILFQSLNGLLLLLLKILHLLVILTLLSLHRQSQQTLASP